MTARAPCGPESRSYRVGAWLAWALSLLLMAAGPAAAQGFYPRGDASCNLQRSAVDVVATLRGLGQASVCGNDDCDRDGRVTAADADCAARCLFGECPIPAHAPRITSVAPFSAPTIVPASAVRVTGTNFGPADRLKRVTIAGSEAEVLDVLSPDSLLVFVPAVARAGPAAVVVISNGLAGPPFVIEVAESAPVGIPDTFDGTMDLLDTAAARFAALGALQHTPGLGRAPSHVSQPAVGAGGRPAAHRVERCGRL